MKHRDSALLLKTRLTEQGYAIIRTANTVYTVGLPVRWRHPDLVITGVMPVVGEHLLAGVLEHIRMGVRYSPGKIELFGRQCWMGKIPVPSQSLAGRMSAMICADHCDMLQIVMSDAAGEPPWSQQYRGSPVDLYFTVDELMKVTPQ